MIKLIIYIPNGQVEFSFKDGTSYLDIEDFIYDNYPNNLGFRIENEQVSRKLKMEKNK